MKTLFSGYNRILFNAETGSGTGSTETSTSEAAAAEALAAAVATKAAADIVPAAPVVPAVPDDAAIEALVQARLEKAVEKALAAEVAGLKSKNAELLGTNKELKTKADKFTGISDEDLAQMLKTREALAKDEIARAITEGRHEEAFEKMSKPWRDNYESQLAKTSAELEEKSREAEEAKQAIATYRITTEISANVGTVKPAYQQLVTTLIKDQVKTIDGQVRVVDASGTVRFNKAGEPMQVAELVETLRPTYGDLFVASGGGGATGAPVKSPVKTHYTAAEADALPFEEYVKARAAGKIK